MAALGGSQNRMSVSDMIARFRSAPPLPREERSRMRSSGAGAGFATGTFGGGAGAGAGTGAGAGANLGYGATGANNFGTTAGAYGATAAGGAYGASGLGPLPNMRGSLDALRRSGPGVGGLFAGAGGGGGVSSSAAAALGSAMPPGMMGEPSFRWQGDPAGGGDMRGRALRQAAQDALRNARAALDSSDVEDEFEEFGDGDSLGVAADTQRHIFADVDGDIRANVTDMIDPGMGMGLGDGLPMGRKPLPTSALEIAEDLDVAFKGYRQMHKVGPRDVPTTGVIVEDLDSPGVMIDGGGMLGPCAASNMKQAADKISEDLEVTFTYLRMRLQKHNRVMVELGEDPINLPFPTDPRRLPPGRIVGPRPGLPVDMLDDDESDAIADDLLSEADLDAAFEEAWRHGGPHVVPPPAVAAMRPNMVPVQGVFGPVPVPTQQQQQYGTPPGPASCDACAAVVQQQEIATGRPLFQCSPLEREQAAARLAREHALFHNQPPMHRPMYPPQQQQPPHHPYAPLHYYQQYGPEHIAQLRRIQAMQAATRPSQQQQQQQQQKQPRSSGNAANPKSAAPKGDASSASKPKSGDSGATDSKAKDADAEAEEANADEEDAEEGDIDQPQRPLTIRWGHVPSSSARAASHLGTPTRRRYGRYGDGGGGFRGPLPVPGAPWAPPYADPSVLANAAYGHAVEEATPGLFEDAVTEAAAAEAARVTERLGARPWRGMAPFFRGRVPPPLSVQQQQQQAYYMGQGPMYGGFDMRGDPRFAGRAMADDSYVSRYAGVLHRPASASPYGYPGPVPPPQPTAYDYGGGWRRGRRSATPPPPLHRAGQGRLGPVPVYRPQYQPSAPYQPQPTAPPQPSAPYQPRPTAPPQPSAPAVVVAQPIPLAVPEPEPEPRVQFYTQPPAVPNYFQSSMAQPGMAPLPAAMPYQAQRAQTVFLPDQWQGAADAAATAAQAVTTSLRESAPRHAAGDQPRPNSDSRWSLPAGRPRSPSPPPPLRQYSPLPVAPPLGYAPQQPYQPRFVASQPAGVSPGQPSPMKQPVVSGSPSIVRGRWEGKTTMPAVRAVPPKAVPTSSAPSSSSGRGGGGGGGGGVHTAAGIKAMASLAEFQRMRQVTNTNLSHR